MCPSLYLNALRAKPAPVPEALQNPSKIKPGGLQRALRSPLGGAPESLGALWEGLQRALGALWVLRCMHEAKKSIRGPSKSLPQETSQEAENSDSAADILQKSTFERDQKTDHKKSQMATAPR